MIDITEPKLLEAQLRQAQKMRAVGRGIAHGFNNIMMIILANADALEEDEELTEHGRRRVAQIAKAIDRAVRVPENSTSITLWRGSK